jgi:phytoene dehydrogenase-like protein
LTTTLLRPRAKIETARLLASIGQIDAAALSKQSARQWLDASIRSLEVRALVEALFRLTTYANAPHELSAATAITQLQGALSANVLYINGGWQTLVDGLRRCAEQAGATIVSSQRVEAVDGGKTVTGLRFADGSGVKAQSVILAIGPREAAGLATESACLTQWADGSSPVRAACLEIALRRLPQARATFALGIDRPLYLSVHSAVARLAPQGNALIHAAKYLPSGASDAAADESELEALLDLVQPGWRDVLVERRFLPKMVVYNAVPTAARGGLAGRPGPQVADVGGLYVAGDWVGGRGLLADASLASARAAAKAIAERRRQPALAA